MEHAMASVTESAKKMGKVCAVMFCGKSSKDGVSVHKAPGDGRVHKSWLDFVRRTREDIDHLKTVYVCSDHFKTSDFCNSLAPALALTHGIQIKRVLERTAVPSIYPVPTASQLDELKNRFDGAKNSPSQVMNSYEQRANEVKVSEAKRQSVVKIVIANGASQEHSVLALMELKMMNEAPDLLTEKADEAAELEQDNLPPVLLDRPLNLPKEDRLSVVDGNTSDITSSEKYDVKSFKEDIINKLSYSERSNGVDAEMSSDERALDHKRDENNSRKDNDIKKPLKRLKYPFGEHSYCHAILAAPLDLNCIRPSVRENTKVKIDHSGEEEHLKSYDNWKEDLKLHENSTKWLKSSEDSKESLNSFEGYFNLCEDSKENFKSFEDSKGYFKLCKDSKEKSKSSYDSKEELKSSEDSKENLKASQDLKVELKSFGDSKKTSKSSENSKENLKASKDWIEDLRSSEDLIHEIIQKEYEDSKCGLQDDEKGLHDDDEGLHDDDEGLHHDDEGLHHDDEEGLHDDDYERLHDDDEGLHHDHEEGLHDDDEGLHDDDDERLHDDEEGLHDDDEEGLHENDERSDNDDDERLDNDKERLYDDTKLVDDSVEDSKDDFKGLIRAWNEIKDDMKIEFNNNIMDRPMSNVDLGKRNNIVMGNEIHVDLTVKLSAELELELQPNFEDSSEVVQVNPDYESDLEDPSEKVREDPNYEPDTSSGKNESSDDIYSSEDDYEPTSKKKIHEKACACDICGKIFGNLEKLSKHVKLHFLSKDYKCDKCDRAYTTKGALNEHMLCHGGTKDYGCGLCDKTFYTSSQQRKHIYNRHNDDMTTCICDQCGKELSSAKNLKKHQAGHNNARPYKCKTCEKSFKYFNNLKAHSFIHADKLPYVCATCKKGFTQKYNLTIHGRIHSGALPFPCPRCQKGYRVKCSMLAHLKKCQN